MFDWTKRLGTTLLKGEETVSTQEALAGVKYVAFYFSAHYCGPCRRFTPLFSVLYEDQPEKQVEVVFVSQDPTNKEFTEYYETMPWLAIPHGSEQIETLATECDVAGIPQVSVFNVQTGELVMQDARPKIVSTKSLAF